MDEFKKGQKVTYCSPHEEKDNGIIKSLNGPHAFVVFNCGGDWENYQNYTAVKTRLIDLNIGWDAEKK